MRTVGQTWKALALVAAAVLAGCTSDDGAGGDDRGYQALGFDGTTWPDLHGAKVTILAYDAFAYAFGPAAEAFHELTNGTAEYVAANDAGSVLEQAIREKGDPSFDVLYGIDNVLMARAIREGVFEPYEPLLGDRIADDLVFAPGWHATPVNHGYIAVNYDPRGDLSLSDFDELRDHADQYVTMDPRTSTPGLGFLLATIATYGEDDEYDYLDYWEDLFDGGVLITAGWSEAYANHFSGGYGQFEEGTAQDRAIVTSYSTSPAYEMFYGYETENGIILAPKATFHSIQTMGIANGTKNWAAAEAWIEFTLTEAFQGLAAEYEAIYPADPSVATQDVYEGRAPEPGSFEDTGFAFDHIDANIERWLAEWEDLYQRSQT